MVGKTKADQSEISFSIPQGTLPWQPNFVGFNAWVRTQADNVAAGRANVGFCPASSLQF